MEDWKKKYEELFGHVQDFHKRFSDQCSIKREIEECIPELTEGEDERIRKEIVLFLRDGNGYCCPNSLKRQSWADWLEKQKERIPEEFSFDGIRKEIADLLRNNHVYSNGKYSIAEMFVWLEKQKEQNLVVQTEKEKQYVKTLKILIDKHFETTNGFDKAYYDHIKKWLDGYHVEPKELKDKFEEYLAASPAERRKMNMNEILRENKERKEKSCALTNAPGGELISSSGKDKNLDEIAQEYIDGVKKYNPEPTWDLMQTAVCYGYHLGKEQKPAEWSEEDKRKINRIYEILGHAADDKGFLTSKRIIGDKEAVELQDFLKSLRPQQKQEWSEDDLLEWIRKNVRSYVNSEYNEFHHTVEYDGSINTDKLIQDLKNWLKSLRPQPHWKPSEEQMKKLNEAIECTKVDLPNMSDCLKSLYEDLKKL